MNSTNISFIEPKGVVNAVSGNEIRREISDAISSGANIILVDLEKVEFIDSSGLGALVASMQLVKSSGGKMFICSVGEQVAMLFSLTKMGRIFQIFNSRDDCISQLSGV